MNNYQLEDKENDREKEQIGKNSSDETTYEEENFLRPAIKNWSLDEIDVRFYAVNILKGF